MCTGGNMRFKDGQPCSHPGCLNHISHPCEICGRINGRYEKVKLEITATDSTIKSLMEYLLIFQKNDLLSVKVIKGAKE
jgi:hypothetical protein